MYTTPTICIILATSNITVTMANKIVIQQRVRCVLLIVSVLLIFMMVVSLQEDSDNHYFGNLLRRNATIRSTEYFVKKYFRLDDQLQFRRSFNNVEFVGFPFNKSSNKYLQRLGLLNIGEIDDAQVLSSVPVHVTAFSDNHYHEAKSMMSYLLERYGGAKKLYVYDLGLSKNIREELMANYSNLIADLRSFPYELYPDHVKNLMSYSWKPLIIAQILSEHPSIWWMDTSAKMKGAIKTVYLDLKNCSTQELQLCAHYPWLTMDNAQHSIFSATEPGMYKYLPIPDIFSKNLTMFGANLQLIYGIKHVKENILKFWVMCALEPDCMAPKEAKLYCEFKDRYADYGKCHRFDQSAVNILLAWANDFKESAYHHHLDSAFVIERGQ